MDSPFTVPLGNLEKDLQNYSWNSGILFTNYVYACKTAVLKDSFSNPWKEIQKQISQGLNPFSDFGFECKFEIQISNLKPDFPIELPSLFFIITGILGTMLHIVIHTEYKCYKKGFSCEEVWGTLDLKHYTPIPGGIKKKTHKLVTHF